MKLASNYVRVAGLAALGIGSRTALAFTEAQRPLGGSTPGNPLDANFQKYVTDLLERWHVPGLAIAIIDGDSTWAEGYGLADVASKIPVTPRTLFFGCSTTKAFAGATVASLIDSGKYRNPSFPQRPVTWATPVSEILPEDFVLQDEWATAHLTLEDALTHRSGLPNHDNAYGGINATLRDHIRSLRHLPLNAPPRVRYQYCNLMFMAASHAVESLTGRDLGSVMQDWIWKPLGMDNTFFELKNAQAAGGQVATGYYWNPKEAAYKAMPYMPLEQTSGAGAIISNVLDYAKWVRALIREDPPLSKAVHEVIKAPRVFESSNPGLYDSPGGYALGWITTSYKGRRLWGHQGSADAWGAEVTFIPSLGFGVVGFANSGIFSNGVIKAVTFKLIEDKLGLANEDREDWEGWFKKRLDNIDDLPNKAGDVLYPERPEVPTKPALPLEKYAGTYYHAAFRNTTISVGPGARRPKATLRFERQDATWALTGELEHVSGEYWILYSWYASLPTMPPDFSPVEFKLGADGSVTGLEIEFENRPKGQGQGALTFEKII